MFNQGPGKITKATLRHIFEAHIVITWLFSTQEIVDKENELKTFLISSFLDPWDNLPYKVIKSA